MRVVPAQREAGGPLRSQRREIGPIGTASRLAGGLLMIAVPVALGGIGWWDVAATLLAIPLIATAAAALVTVGFQRFAPESLGRSHAICSGPGCALLFGVIGIASALTFVTPANEASIWVFFGASMLVAGARGYAGCEVLAFPNAITGRRDRIGCLLYTPIDSAETRHQAARAREAAGAQR
ncbi:MAG: hypothetical protein ACRDN8_00010 [Thermoleophilaceae bacterium]